jgi:hypothetical protein
LLQGRKIQNLVERVEAEGAVIISEETISLKFWDSFYLWSTTVKQQQREPAAKVVVSSSGHISCCCC